MTARAAVVEGSDDGARDRRVRSTRRATTRAQTRREKISIADDELTTDDDDDDDDSTTTRAVEMTSDDNRDVFDADVEDAGCDSIESASDSEAAFGAEGRMSGSRGGRTPGRAAVRGSRGRRTAMRSSVGTQSGG